MDEKLVGIKTINGTIIKGKSYHSIARVIGSVDNVLNALMGKDAEVLPIKEMKNGRSQKYRTNKVEVSVNPDNGKIIQVNAYMIRKKV